FCHIILFLLISGDGLSQTRDLYVFEHGTTNPIPDAHIHDDEKMIALTNGSGFAQIPSSINEVTIHVLGYKTQTFSLVASVDTLYLEKKVYFQDDEVIIYGYGESDLNTGNYHHSASHHTLDKLLSNVDGLAMIQRGAYAWEPSVRGLDDQRINVMIDGMQVFKACVDKMDPVTAYVESDNISKLDINKSGTGVAEHGGSNASINLITKKATFNAMNFDVRTGFRYPDNYRVLTLNSDLSGDQHALRFSGSVKQADEFVAGGNETVANTGFNKINLNLGYRGKIRNGDFLDVNFIFDDARDVGYPALLMDATQATANMLRLQYEWTNPETQAPGAALMIYANSVRHWMDDYERDVTHRVVMANMNMPMYVDTYTTGFQLSKDLSIFGNNGSAFFDGYLTKAFGDMEMISIFDIEDMYLLNLGDVVTGNLRFGWKMNVPLSQKLLWKFEQSTEFTRVEVTDESSISYFEGLYDRDVNPRGRFLPSASSSLLYLHNDTWSVNFETMFSQRLPNYVELYGQYIYNYVDGFFYYGNPFLKPETTLHFELSPQFTVDNSSLSVSVFYKRLYNYIYGTIDTETSNEFFQFKDYNNLGDVNMAGGEARWLSNWGSALKTDLRASYLYAQNQTLNDPLPLISPLNGSLTTTYSVTDNNFSFMVEWATRQTRIAEQTTIEDRTDGFVILNFDYTRSWLNGKLVSNLEFRNLLDAYYNRHTSIGNIPDSGRSIMLSVKYQL
ncbi:MAG: TonB-dependent receptor, partial [Balneolales bacterium]|nr:TonB-dependent receptor [Balneolales bacterium]